MFSDGFVAAVVVVVAAAVAVVFWSRVERKTFGQN